MEQWWILGLGQEVDKVGPEHLVMPESEEVLKDKANNPPRPHNGGASKGPRSNGENSQRLNGKENAPPPEVFSSIQIGILPSILFCRDTTSSPMENKDKSVLPHHKK